MTLIAAYKKDLLTFSFKILAPARMRENTDQNNSKYGHFSRSVYFQERKTFSFKQGFMCFYNLFKDVALRSLRTV